MEKPTPSIYLFNTGTSPIRLVGGGGPWEGRVEVMHNGQWGTVCDTGFGNEEAQVVCKMLGFRDGYGITYYFIWMKDLD